MNIYRRRVSAEQVEDAIELFASLNEEEFFEAMDALNEKVNKSIKMSSYCIKCIKKTDINMSIRRKCGCDK